mmetsp:Transcript_31427/g.82427  ORF Transcript_31427/g.82427 Transcript_31427/m.82427 type:complete len:270 (-) Transcript_31427:134-943(-)
MSFLANLLGTMDKPPERDPEIEAMKKQSRLAEIEMVKQEEKEEAQFTEKIKGDVAAFIKSAGTTSRFPPMRASERAIVHTVSAKAGLYPLAFGDEALEDRNVVVFKQTVRPSEKDVELMDRELPYDACMAALKVTKKRLAEEAARDRERSLKAAAKKVKVVAATQSAKQQRIAQLVGDTSGPVAPKQSGGYGMVPAHLRSDKRSLEEVERDMRAKRAKISTEKSESDPPEAAGAADAAQPAPTALPTSSAAPTSTEGEGTTAAPAADRR